MAGRSFIFVVLLLVVVTAPAGAGSTSTPGSAGQVIVVDDDGGTDYTTIQSAVSAADPGDTVRVQPGTYREMVTVDVNVTMVAPHGATLDGSGLGDGSTAIEIGEHATPVVDGFTITGYSVGVDAGSTTTGWIVRNSTISDTGFMGISAVASTGDWRVRDVVIGNTSTGIRATYATGRWRVTDTVIRNATEGRGVVATESEGDWILDNVTVEDVDFVAVSASYSTGDWRIVNSTVREATVGIGALDASGNWAVRGSTVANVSVSERYDFWQPPLEEGIGLHAGDTNGSWTVRRSRFVGNEAGAIVADGADPAGDATRNWWGSVDGPDNDDCTGNVDCTEPLSAWPPDSSVTSPSPTPEMRASTDRTVTTLTSLPTSMPRSTDPGLVSLAFAFVGLVAVVWFVGTNREWF